MRTGASDRPLDDMSAFAVEMADLRDALACPSPCLLLLDEFARGTNGTEGGAMTVAVLEHVQRSRDITAIVSTHLQREMAQFRAIDDGLCRALRLGKSHCVEEGVCTACDTAVETAQKWGVPAKIVQRTCELLGKPDSNVPTTATDPVSLLERKTGIMMHTFAPESDPPASFQGHSCLYMARINYLDTQWWYVGETDDVTARMRRHRQEWPGTIDTVVVGRAESKSHARCAETAGQITLQRSGVRLWSTHDGMHRNFGGVVLRNPSGLSDLSE